MVNVLIAYVKSLTRIDIAAMLEKMRVEKKNQYEINYAQTKASRINAVLDTRDLIPEKDWADDGIPAAIRITHQELLNATIPPRSSSEEENSTEIRVLPEDCLKVAKSAPEVTEKVLLLNMANGSNPGGGAFIQGTYAQEEYLFTVTNLMVSLLKFAGLEGYLAPDGGNPNAKDRPRYKASAYGFKDVLISKDVKVIRKQKEGAKGEYTNLAEAEQFNIDVISAAALRYTAELEEFHYFEDGDRKNLNYEAGKKVMSDLIYSIVKYGAVHQYDRLVLSALGCGAFGNDPYWVATLFKQTLALPEFKGCFKNGIDFGIIKDDKNNDVAFKQVFDEKEIFDVKPGQWKAAQSARERERQHETQLEEKWPSSKVKIGAIFDAEIVDFLKTLKKQKSETQSTSSWWNPFSSSSSSSAQTQSGPVKEGGSHTIARLLHYMATGEKPLEIKDTKVWVETFYNASEKKLGLQLKITDPLIRKRILEACRAHNFDITEQGSSLYLCSAKDILLLLQARYKDSDEALRGMLKKYGPTATQDIESFISAANQSMRTATNATVDTAVPLVSGIF